jgi:hypothetical protein
LGLIINIIMKDKDDTDQIWDAYISESTHSPENSCKDDEYYCPVDKVCKPKKDKDTVTEADTDGNWTVQSRLDAAAKKAGYVDDENDRPNYNQAVSDHERFSDIAAGIYGDMEEAELKLHLDVLEDLLEMEELSRREAQGQGPQRDTPGW